MLVARYSADFNLMRDANVAERTNITNFLLLSILTGFLLVSGSLQSAFDCLTQADSLYVAAIRVDNCHPNIAQVDPVDSCLNKACHQGNTHHHNLTGPEIHSSGKQPQPLVGSYRQPSPQYRAGSLLILPTIDLQPQLAFQATTSTAPPQALYGIRTTILLN